MGSKTDLPQTLRFEAGYYFGSLRHAQRALKNDPKLRRAGASKRIIAVLCRMHRSRDRLAYASARREIPALVSAAGANFGSWGKACMPLGLIQIYILSITSGANRGGYGRRKRSPIS